MKLKHAPAIKQNTNLIGQFVGYELKDGHKIKRIQLLTADGIVSLKLTKTAKACLFRLSDEVSMQPGALLSVSVEQKYDDGQLKYKVHDLQILATASEAVTLDLPCCSTSRAKYTGKKIKIRVCDRGTCRKRGAGLIYDRLQQAMIDRSLADQVVLEKSSCLKECKRGPNVAVGKTCHSRICPSTAVELLSLPAELQSIQRVVL
jgi:hypothetical protein